MIGFVGKVIVMKIIAESISLGGARAVVEYEYSIGDRVILSAPEFPYDPDQFLAGWIEEMDDCVGREAVVTDFGRTYDNPAPWKRDGDEITSYLVEVDGIGSFYWDCDYMRPVSGPSIAEDLAEKQELERSFYEVFGWDDLLKPENN